MLLCIHAFTIPSTAPDCQDAYGHRTTQYFITSFIKQQTDSDNVSVNFILFYFILFYFISFARQAGTLQQREANLLRAQNTGQALGVVTARVHYVPQN